MNEFRRRLMTRNKEALDVESFIYTTTSKNQSVQIIFKQEYAEKIELENGAIFPTNIGILNYTFLDIGEHKVKIKFKKDITDFSHCFNECTNLTSIPNNLFADNTIAINFSYCFYYCTNLTSPCPIDKDNTPLYNRSSGKTGYSNVTSHSSCFYNCTKMSDYSSIPSNWK